MDTGSTFSVFKNPDMVLNIRDSKRTLKAHTNGGRQDSSRVADLPGFFTVWFNPASMINILAWCDVTNKFRITADTSIGKYITVHLSAERKMIFEEVRSGLYLFRNKAHINNNNRISRFLYLMLTEANMSNFTKRQIDDAKKARELHKSFGFPGYKQFLWSVQNNKTPNSKVTLEDAKRALHLFGVEPVTVKGKTPRLKQSKITCEDRMMLPKSILVNHRKVHIMVDYMFVQGVQFLTTISHKLKFRTAEALPYVNKRGVKKEDILNGIKKVIKLYKARGLTVEQVHGDNEFECIREDIRPV